MTRARQHAVRRTLRLVAAVTLAAGLAGCGNDDPEPESGSTPSATASTSTQTTDSTAAASETADPPPPDDRPFGPGCDRYLPESGPTLDRVAETPTPNYVLLQSSLQDAFGKMMQIGIGTERDVTYFVPTNQAVNLLPFEVRGELVGDPDAARTFFGHHVVTERLAPSALAGEHRTLAKDTLSITVSGEDVGVGLQGADVVCGNIQTLDATIYVVDQALQS